MSPKNESQESALARFEGRHLGFSLGAEEYAIPLLSVKEVIAPPPMTPIPSSPPHFLGITNLRGQVISIIDLRKKMGIKPSEQGEPAVIICDLGISPLGVLVDTIDSVFPVDPSLVSDKPTMQKTAATEAITAVYRKEGKLVLFLDLLKALGAEDRRVMGAPSGKAA